MKTLLFMIFIIAMLGLGAAWLRARAQRIAEEGEARANARAELLGIAALAQDQSLAASLTPATPQHVTPKTTRVHLAATPAFADPPRTDASPAPAPANKVTSTRAPTARTRDSDASAESGPPSNRRLRKMSRSRFARVGITYFEILGFRARRFNHQEGAEAPIDALLFMGTASVPTMAVRWSRSEGERATIDEVRSFADACAALRIPRSTFIAQFGLDDEASGYADSRGVVCLDADTLARRLADTDTVHHARLHEVAYGSR